MDAVSRLRLLICPRAILLPHHQEKGLGGVVLAGIPVLLWFYIYIYKMGAWGASFSLHGTRWFQESLKLKYVYIAGVEAWWRIEKGQWLALLAICYVFSSWIKNCPPCIGILACGGQGLLFVWSVSCMQSSWSLALALDPWLCPCNVLGSLPHGPWVLLIDSWSLAFGTYMCHNSADGDENEPLHLIYMHSDLWILKSAPCFIERHVYPIKLSIHWHGAAQDYVLLLWLPLIYIYIYIWWNLKL